MKRLKKIMGCMLILALIIIQIVVYGHIVGHKSDEIKYNQFFEQEENFDVLFMGSSHVLNAVLPMELWNDYGIVSYNMGGHGCTIPLSYWMLKMALEYTTPKLVVIDGYFIGNDTKEIEEIGYAHISLDAFPMTKTKALAINDLFKDENKMEFFWQFSLYHNRWSKLNKEDFIYKSNMEMGAEMRIGVAEPKVVDADKNEYLEKETIAMEYMGKIIELCQSNGIEVLLTYLPYPVESYAEANSMNLIAEKYEVNYINFLETEIVNYETDCYDENSHLNPSGAWKVTDYLGQFIADNYDITDQRENDVYSEKWDDYYNKYVLTKIEKFNNNELNNQMMLMYDNDFNWGIYIPDTEKFYQEEIHKSLLFNLGVNEQDVKKAGGGIIYIDNNAGCISYISKSNQDDIMMLQDKTNITIDVEGDETYCFIVNK